MRRLLAAGILVIATIGARAQSPVVAPVLEAASIKPSPPGSSPTPPGAYGPPTSSTGRFRSATLKTLVMVAFGLSPLQRHDAEPMGGPVWVDSNLYDVEMKATDLPTVPQARALMLALLEDRFKLRWHTEQRELPVYALVFARSDRQLAAGIKPSMLDCRAYSDTLQRTGRGAAAKEQGPDCGLSAGGAPAFAAAIPAARSLPRGAQIIRGSATMAELVVAMTRDRENDRPVIDRTGLTGTFDIDLWWVPARSGAIVADPGDVLPLVTAVQQQLGLKLEPRREPRDVIVIDSAELPTPD